MAWTRSQKKVLAILPKMSSVFSLCGSSWIIVEVWTNNDTQPKRKNPYHRLLFAMSAYDVLESIWNFQSTWTIPRETEGTVWAFGTVATCNAQGFFLTLSVAVPIYNALLSLYYLLVIKYKYSDEKLSKQVEPLMHLCAGGWGFGTAIYSVATGLINNANLWCWIAPLPTDCKDSWRFPDEANCIRGDNAWIYRWGFYFAPLWFCILFATVCTIMVYRYVWKLDKATAKYRFSASVRALNRDNAATSFYRVTPPRETAPGGTMDNSRHARVPSVAMISDVLSSDDDEAGVLGSACSCSDDEVLADPPIRSSSGRFLNFDGSLSGETLEKKRKLRLQKRNLNKKKIDRRAELRAQYREECRRSKAVLNQALLYLGVFFLTHLWSTTNRILQQVFLGDSVYGLVVMNALCDPLQGGLNYFVYQWPRYTTLRKRYPEVGRTGALYRLLRFSSMPEPAYWETKRIAAILQTEIDTTGNVEQ